jgi:carbonic anhydrase
MTDEQISPLDALRRLKQGNQRFMTGTPNDDSTLHAVRRAALLETQKPFAVILGCSDSRVPAEIVFDQGLGDLFVIRVAGNIVAPSQLGSIEFAVQQFAIGLVIVMGHSRCGAIEATLNNIRSQEPAATSNIASIIARIRPAIEPLARALSQEDPLLLQQAAVLSNIQASVNQVRRGTSMLEELIISQRLIVAGASYDLASGEVMFLDF